MPSHKVRVGDVVLPKPALSQNIAGGTYQVTRLLPESGELNIGSRILRSRTSVLRGKVSLPQHRQLSRVEQRNAHIRRSLSQRWCSRLLSLGGRAADREASTLQHRAQNFAGRPTWRKSGA